MAEKDISILAEVFLEPSVFPELADEERHFWEDPIEVEQLHGHEFLMQPGYTENAKLRSGPLFGVIQHLRVGQIPPESARKQAGQQMAKLRHFTGSYDLPNNPNVRIDIICCAWADEMRTIDTMNENLFLEELTKDAVVFNVRFHLGRDVTQERLFSALTKFLSKRGGSMAKKLKIAFWEHDFWENRAAENKDELALSAIDLSIQLAAQLSEHVEMVALERRVMSDKERHRQKKMHCCVASPEELERLNSVLSSIE